MANKGGNSISCRIHNRLRHYHWELVRVFCTAFTRVKAIVQSVEIGKDCRFFGVPVFIVSKNGYISVGKSCTFRSCEYSNPIGLSHGCILSATPAYGGTTARLSIGDNCGLSGVSVRCFRSVSIGNNVRIGANTVIMDGDAHFEDPRTTPPLWVAIEDDVFIGANCVVKKGVTIGRGAMIGMNSVVTRDVPPHTVAVGVPARVVRTLMR